MSEFNRNESGASGVGPGGAIAAGVLHEAEAWTTAQCEFLSGVGAIWTDWIARQREVIDASARSLQQMYECRSIADLFQLQQQWLAEATRRGTSDIGILASDAVALTWRLAGSDRTKARGVSLPARTRGPAKSADDASLQRAAAE